MAEGMKQDCKNENKKFEHVSISTQHWQDSLTDVKMRCEFLYLNDTMSDISFLVGKDKKKIPAHKFLLSCGSSVFYSMFYGSLVEKDPVELPDVEEDAFLCLLKFLYTDSVTLYMDSVMQVKLFEKPDLEQLCLKTIDKQSVQAFSSVYFTDIDHKILCSVIKKCTLESITEVELFKDVFRWSEAECLRKNWEVNGKNKRKAIGKALLLIRFPLMSLLDFNSYVTKSELLDEQELLLMYDYFSSTQKPLIKFSEVPRSSTIQSSKKHDQYGNTGYR